MEGPLKATHIAIAILPTLIFTGCEVTTVDTPTHAPTREAAEAVEDVFERVHTLRVAVLYNDEDFQVRYEFPTDRPSWYHQYKVYRNGVWEDADGSGAGGPVESGLYEDRISIMIDDGSVNGFDLFGAYVVAHAGTRSYPDEVPGEDVEGTFITEGGYGSDVRKYILESREEGATPQWRSARSDEDLLQLRQQGVFLNSIQWRAHRSNPMGLADQGYVLEYRNSAGGRGMYSSNWDEEAGQPRYMYDSEQVGMHALEEVRLLAQGYSQNDLYYLAEDFAVPFDAGHIWQEGDTLPAVYLHEGEGSRVAARAHGEWSEGAWRVRVTRSLQAPDPLDSKTLEEGNFYNVQFAVHTHSTGARWHLVSMPMPMGIGAPGFLEAVRVDGPLDEAEAPWTDVPLHYPGILTLEELQSDPRAAGALAPAVANPLDAEEVASFLEFVLEHEKSRMAGGK